MLGAIDRVKGGYRVPAPCRWGHGPAPPDGGAVGNLVSTETLNADEGYTLAVDLLRRYLRENQRLEWVKGELGAGVKATSRG